MKNIIKKITAIAMCGVLTVGSVLMTGAVSEDENHKDFEVTGTTQKISNNQLFVTTTGYTENTAKNFGAMFISTDYQKYSVMFNPIKKKMILYRIIFFYLSLCIYDIA